MRVVPLCPFPVLPLRWQARPSRWALTVLVKGTFDLIHGADAAIAASQEPAAGDRLWGSDPRAGLYAPSDWVPMKPRADVLLVGHAHAPGGSPVETLIARLETSGVDKIARITGERRWVRGFGGALGPSRPGPFTRFPLRSDLAPTSPENPFGLADAPANEGALALPSIDPGTFGPIAPNAPSRR
jgi:hypothetical protein